MEFSDNIVPRNASTICQLNRNVHILLLDCPYLHIPKTHITINKLQ